MVTPLARSAGRKSVTVDPSSTSVGKCQEIVIIDSANKWILIYVHLEILQPKKSNEMHQS